MNPFRWFLGRRQFLIGSMASASALAFSPFVENRNVADASETSPGVSSPGGGAGTGGTMGGAGRYRHLLSPLRIRNVVIRNRIIHTIGIPHFLQGPETWPSEVYREYYARFARNGAAIVVVPGVVVSTESGKGQGVSRKGVYGDSAHMERFDTSNPACENYLDQIVAAVHSFGALVCAGGVGFGGVETRGGDIRDPKKQIENAVTQAKLLEDKGVDMIFMGGEYKDKEKVKSVIDQIQAVKNATNLLIGMRLNVRHVLERPETFDNNVLSEPALEDAVTIAKLYDGAVDILQFRLGAAMGSHPTCWNMEEGRPNSLIIAKAIRESGSGIYLAPNGGFQDPGENNAFIESGQCDFVTMIRPFHADFDYAQKAYEGRGEDVVPCIQCDKCHGLSMEGPWTSVCSVNPKLGIEPAVRIITPPAVSKKVAVIGGGPAGMMAALTAAERGHRVTLYEKDGALGGLLRHADECSFKWGLRRYKEYLIRQVKKAGIDVRLNTTATPEMIQPEAYDVVMAALGAAPSIPKIRGSDDKNVHSILEAYAGEKELGKNVVVVGGGEYGVGVGMFLAKAGHKTTMLTSAKELLPIKRVHWGEIITDVYENLPGLTYKTDVIPTRISNGKVFYTSAGGGEQSVKADSVVLYSGLKPRLAEALAFYSSAGNAFFTIGDCTGKCGDVQKSARNAFFTASQF